MAINDRKRESQRLKFAQHREKGLSIADACVAIGIDQATFRLWNRKRGIWKKPGGWGAYDKDGGYVKRASAPRVRTSGYDKDGPYHKRSPVPTPVTMRMVSYDKDGGYDKA